MCCHEHCLQIGQFPLHNHQRNVPYDDDKYALPSLNFKLSLDSSENIMFYVKIDTSHQSTYVIALLLLWTQQGELLVYATTEFLTKQFVIGCVK
jgi:hypothetical protein